MSDTILLEELTWKDARKDIKASEPELSRIIDTLSPGKDYKLIKVKYPFGATIFKEGIFHLPTEGNQTVPISHAKIPTKIRDLLGYQKLPLGCITNHHGVEVFRELDERIFSLAFFNSGLNLGIWETFSQASPFTVSAGARSLIMLPKIADAHAHRKLIQKFGIDASVPVEPFTFYNVLQKLAAHQNFGSTWNVEVIFLTAKWQKMLKNDRAWMEFKNFILTRAWEHIALGRNKVIIFDLVWELFSRTLSKYRIKPASYVIDTFKHLIFVALGALPAYCPATDNLAGPLLEAQKAYLDVYQLKASIPTIMRPIHFNKENNHPVYYSMQIPTHLETSPKSRDTASVKHDMDELIWLFDKFAYEINNNQIGSGNLEMKELLKYTKFDFFHTETGEAHRILPTSRLIEEDKRFLHIPTGYATRSFAERGTFIRGCLRISNRNK